VSVKARVKGFWPAESMLKLFHRLAFSPDLQSTVKQDEHYKYLLVKEHMDALMQC